MKNCIPTSPPSRRRKEQPSSPKKGDKIKTSCAIQTICRNKKRMFSPVPIRASSDCSFPPPPNIQKNAAISAMSGQMNSRANKIELHNKVVERLCLYLCITALKGITMNNIFERDLKGEMVSPSDTGYDELINSIWKTMKTGPNSMTVTVRRLKSAEYWERLSGKKWMNRLLYCLHST